MAGDVERLWLEVALREGILWVHRVMWRRGWRV